MTRTELDALIAYCRASPGESWNPLYDAIEEYAEETKQTSRYDADGTSYRWIRPGRFRMGARLDDVVSRYTPEMPQHEVVLSSGFWMADSPVTVGQYRLFMEATGHTESELVVGAPMPAYTWKWTGFEQGHDHPVVCVTLFDAVAYCNWMSRTDRDNVYLLPTEAQWEYAARAGTIGPRYNFYEPPNHGFDVIAWSQIDGRGTHPVRLKRANQWGLYDMLGNVHEWTFSEYDGYTSDRIIDPVANPMLAVSGPVREFVCRGCGWSVPPDVVRVSFRMSQNPWEPLTSLGFRVIMVPKRKESAA